MEYNAFHSENPIDSKTKKNIGLPEKCKKNASAVFIVIRIVIQINLLVILFVGRDQEPPVFSLN